DEPAARERRGNDPDAGERMELIQPLLDFLRDARPQLDQMVQQSLPLTYALLFLVIFVETGLVVMPFLPGDSLLFLLGAMAAGNSGLSLPLLLLLLTLAAVLGDAVNYQIGHHLGPKVFRSEHS